MAAKKHRALLPVGSPAPDWRLAALAGGEESLSGILAGGPAVLAFFKVNCPTCQFTFPFLERLYSGGVLRVYGISQNNARDTRDFCREFGITLPVLLDPEDGFPASNAYGIVTVPTLFQVERDGSVSCACEGWSRAEIERLGVLAGIAPFGPREYVPEWKAG